MSVPRSSRETPLSTTGRALLLAWAIVLISGFLVALRLSPDPRGFGTHQQLGLSPCLFRLALGYPCAACGMTTSFAHFVRGHLVEATHANPAAVVCATVFVLMIPWCLLSVMIGRCWLVSEPLTVSVMLIASLGILTVLVWIVRLIILVSR